MKRLFLIGTLLLVISLAILATGCTFPMTSSPTPTSSSQDVSQYLTTMMQQRNFTMMTPFSFQPSTRAGVAIYNGTANDGNGSYAISVQAWNVENTARERFVSIRDAFLTQGYTTIQQNATMWSGFNTSAGNGAAVEYGTSPLMPYYMMVITGGAIGQTPFQLSMWQHLWDAVHTPDQNGGGMGQFMGVGMTIRMQNSMQQEMQGHMGVA